MKKVFLAATVASLFLLQPCFAQAPAEAPAKVQETKTARVAPTPTPVSFEANIAKLSSENTSISFIGRHVTKEDAPDPNQRLGGFKDFTGEIHLNEDGKSLKAIVLEFQTDSIFTPIPDLTKHLKAADFLNVKEFPNAKFVSTAIKPYASAGQVEVTGDFTLMGKTQSISMPCMVKMTDEGILIDSEFNLDRTQFGMSGMTEKVSKMVSIKMNVGTKTAEPKAGGQQMRGGQGRRGGSTAERFKTMDANGDGKLAGDEIPERMKQFLGNMDTDGNGELTLEEMEAAVKKFRQGGGGNRGGGGNK